MILHCGATKMAAILSKSPPLPPKSIAHLPHSNAAHLAYCCPLRPLSDPISLASHGNRRNALLSSGFGTRNFNLVPLRAEPGGETGGGAGGGGKGGNGGRGGGGSGGGAGDGSGGNGSSSNLLSWYLMALDKHPVFTKAITSALLTFIGDLICQLCFDKVSKLDLKRTLVFTLLGLVLVGPTLHFWYLYLSELITQPGATGALMRLLLDQFVFSPVFIGVFLSSVVALEGRPSQIKPKLQQEWFSSVLANWQLWIPFQFLNFRFVPQQFQVLAANFVALAWNVILSFKAHKEVVLK